jgi:exodeoxyribonuclease III
MRVASWNVNSLRLRLEYSRWDYRQGTFRRNLGLRIDHCWIGASLASGVTGAFIDKAERPRRARRTMRG